MYDTILLPTDGSAGVEPALEHAIHLAREHGATLHVVYVVDTSSPFVSPDAAEAHWGEILDLLERDGQKAVAEVRQRAAEHEVETVGEVLQGNSVHKVLERYIEDHGIELVVMGSRGRGGLGRFLLGSVTERLLRLTRVPVMVVPLKEP